MRVFVEEALCIEVSDNGCGMDEVTREKAFEPLFTTKSPSDGFGLGLFVCKNILEGLGGSIEVESRPDEGTTFRVLLHEPRFEEARAGTIQQAVS